MRNGTLQESMRSFLVELDFQCPALTFISTPSLFMRVAKTPVRLNICAHPSEPSLLPNTKRTKLSGVCSYYSGHKCCIY